MKIHEEEINEVYKKEKAKNIDVDLNAIIMERREEKFNKKKIEAIVKSEKEKWSLLKKHQDEKKLRANRAKYDKFLVQEPNKMRILVLGESCSGKTCLIKRYINDEFSPEYITTLTIQAYKSDLLFFEDTSYRIELIDTPPLEKFYKLLDDVLYFVQGIILVFDGSNKNSFLRMMDYFKMINFYEFQRIGIVATKKDICKENDKYKYYQLEKFCQQHKAIHSFISSKNGKEEISNFINLLCPEIIPSLVNKKEELKLMYPYTKSIKNNIPQKNIIDEAIIKKAKEEDSSYESEEIQKDQKDKEAEIREYYLRKNKKPEKKKIKPKPNYIYNIGNNINKKFQEDNESFNFEEKKEEMQSFNNVIGNVNLDLEKLFKKYRPDSGSIKNKKNNRRKLVINKKNQTIEEDRNWVNVNIDSLIEEFMKTKSKFKDKGKTNYKNNKIQNKIKSEDKKGTNEIENSKSNKSGKSKKENIQIENNRDKNTKSNKSENNKSEKSKKEEKQILQNSEESSNIKSENKSNKEDSVEYNDESMDNKKENMGNEKKESEESGNENRDEEEYSDDENYDDIMGDIYHFQQNMIKEAMEEEK